MVNHKEQADGKQEVSSNQAGGIHANIDTIGMERINAHKRVKREATKAGGATEAGGASKGGGKTGTTKSSASDLIVYFPIYIVSFAVLLQD